MKCLSAISCKINYLILENLFLLTDDLNFPMQPPFICGNRDKIQQKIIKDKIKLPAFLSSEAHTLLKGVIFVIFPCNLKYAEIWLYQIFLTSQLLQKEPSRRLDSLPKWSDEIKGHKWFEQINWKKLESRGMQPSFRPEVAGKHCIANFDRRYTEMPLSDSPVSRPKVDGSLFQGFTYVRPAASFLQRNSPLC